MRLLTVATASLAIALVPGCSDESEPVPAPLPSSVTQPPTSPTPTPAETPTPTATAPSLPEEAQGSRRTAAEAFVRYYVDLINYAGTTGDVNDLSALAAPSCVSCRRLINTFADTYTAGGFYRTKGWAVETILLVAESDSSWTASTQVRASRVHWRTSATAEPTVAPPETLNLQFQIRHSGGRWIVTRMTRS